MMAPQIPLWFALLLIPVIFWPVTLVAAIGFGVFGKWFRGVGRWVCWGLCGVLLLFPLAGLVMYSGSPVSEWWNTQRLKRISGKLQQPLTVAGITLPVGTDVRWSQTDRSDFAEADLPGTVVILGVKAKGKVYHAHGDFKLTLAEPQAIDGWACAEKNVWLGKDLRLQFCVLSKDVSWHGLVVPAGAGVARENGIRFSMPDDRGMKVLGGLAVPPGGELRAQENGSLLEVHASWNIEKDYNMTLVERGVSLETDADFFPSPLTEYDESLPVKALGLRSKLMLNLPCARETIKAGVQVEVRGTGGEVRVIPDFENGRVRVVPGCLR